MKAVILAAGKGSRLGSLTTETPKSMLKLNEKHTLLSFNIQQISNLNIDSIILISGYEFSKMKDYAVKLSNQYNIQIDIVYNPFWNYCNVLGSLYMGLDKINDDFIFLHADTITEKGVMEGLLNSKSENCLAVDFKNCGEEEMKFWLEDGIIKRITKEDIGRVADGEFVGIAKFNKSMINYFLKNSIELFQGGELNYYMEEVLDSGLKKNDLIVDIFDASKFKTIEIDFEEDLELGRTLFKSFKN